MIIIVFSTAQVLCFITVADMSTGRVGPPLTCCEIRLRDWPEGKQTYTVDSSYLELGYLKFCETRNVYLNQ